jgi:hypothetical protein
MCVLYAVCAVCCVLCAVCCVCCVLCAVCCVSTACGVYVFYASWTVCQLPAPNFEAPRSCLNQNKSHAVRLKCHFSFKSRLFWWFELKSSWFSFFSKSFCQITSYYFISISDFDLPLIFETREWVIYGFQVNFKYYVKRWQKSLIYPIVTRRVLVLIVSSLILFHCKQRGCQWSHRFLEQHLHHRTAMER